MQAEAHKSDLFTKSTTNELRGICFHSVAIGKRRLEVYIRFGDR